MNQKPEAFAAAFLAGAAAALAEPRRQTPRDRRAETQAPAEPPKPATSAARR